MSSNTGVDHVENNVSGTEDATVTSMQNTPTENAEASSMHQEQAMRNVEIQSDLEQQQAHRTAEPGDQAIGDTHPSPVVRRFCRSPRSRNKSDVDAEKRELRVERRCQMIRQVEGETLDSTRNMESPRRDVASNNGRSRTAGTNRPSKRPLNNMHSSPGAVQTPGRAYGAPRRPSSSQTNLTRSIVMDSMILFPGLEGLDYSDDNENDPRPRNQDIDIEARPVVNGGNDKGSSPSKHMDKSSFSSHRTDSTIIEDDILPYSVNAKVLFEDSAYLEEQASAPKPPPFKMARTSDFGSNFFGDASVHLEQDLQTKEEDDCDDEEVYIYPRERFRCFLITCYCISGMIGLGIVVYFFYK